MSLHDRSRVAVHAPRAPLLPNEALGQVAKLDGCYVLKTDLSAEAVDKEVVDARYRDLASVEWVFRMSKTAELEMRPVHVRLASRTRGHAFVVMLAYRITRALADRWCQIDLTVEEGLGELTALCLALCDAGVGGP